MTSVERSLKGTETVRKLRAKGVRSIICGLSANNLGKSFEEAGADEFQLKPFPCKKDALYTLMQQLLSKRDYHSFIDVPEGTSKCSSADDTV